MAKVSSVEKNNRRKKLSERFKAKRKLLKEKIYDKKLPLMERIELIDKLAKLPRNSAPSRVRGRCALTGRPRGYYRKFRLSRNMLREMAANGLIPGLVKASW